MIDSAGIKMAQGTSIACERISGVNDNMTQSHYHDYFELYYLESGERYKVIEGKTYHFLPGQYVLFPPFTMHHSFGMNNTPFKRIVLYFRPDQILYPALLEKMTMNEFTIFHTDKKELIHIHRFLTELLKEDKPGSEFLTGQEERQIRTAYMQSLLNTLFLTAYRKNGSENRPETEKQDQIGAIVDYIHHNYFTDLSLESLSKIFYISPYHLCHEFKKHTQRTLVDYINVTRIMNAQRRIMETNKTLTEICHLTGFSNLTHFNRVFKQITGITPSEYRKNYRQSVSAKQHK